MFGDSVCWMSGPEGAATPMACAASICGQPRRGLHQDQRRAEVPVAGRRRQRQCPRHPGADPPRQSRGQAFLPPTPHDRRGARGERHRQAPFLQRTPTRPGALGRGRSHKGLNNRAENAHQPTRQRERATKASAARKRPQIPRRVQRHLTSLPTPPIPPHRQPPPPKWRSPRIVQA
jgi:hypothetical protein